MKSSHRVLRVAELIQKEIAQYLIHGAKDSRIGFVTVTGAKVTGDLQIARIYFTVYGTDKEKEISTLALNESIKEIRRHLAMTLNLRFTPELEFYFDEKLEENLRLEKIFHQIAKK
ncbi:MAG: 30S ribosome-binding factor RbfA [Oligoflexia bacterium]|nr:30S ribosome-binding factor RbfA [Oligoflexia bacterium]